MTVLQSLGNSIKGYFGGIASDPFGLKYSAEQKKKKAVSPVPPALPVNPLIKPVSAATITPPAQNPAVRPVIPKITAPASPTIKPPTSPTAGMVAINGAQYNTRELQQGAFNNIQAIGNTLYGVPKNQAPASPASPAVPNVAGISATPPPPAPVPPTPPAPVIPNVPETPAPVGPYDTPEYKTAVSGYESALKMTPEEEANAKAQADLEASVSLGQANTSNQPIAMDFITGQNAAIEKRGLALQQPLAARAALLQAKRTAALDASKFKIEQMNTQIENAKETTSPVSVGAGSSLVDPKTGKVIYKGERAADEQAGFTLGAGQTRYDASGKLIASRGSSDSGEESAPVIKTFGQTDYSWNKQTGQWDPVSLSTNSPQAKIDKANRLLSDINDLRNTKGMESAVGFKGASSLWGFLKDPLAGSPASDYAAKLKSIIGQLTLENMGVMKGVLSDSDMKIITSASTALTRDMSEPEYAKELIKIENVMKKVIENGGAGGDAADGGFNW